MLLDILTPEKLLYQGEVKSIKVPGTNGEFEILNNHASIIYTLYKGDIFITDTENKKKNFSINGGVIEMQKNKIIVLAE